MITITGKGINAEDVRVPVKVDAETGKYSICSPEDATERKSLLFVLVELVLLAKENQK